MLLARDICPVSNVKFDFLGYCFGPRRAKNLQNASVFCSFLPRLSASALKFMRAAIRDLNLRKRTHVSMADIARQLNPLLRGDCVLRSIQAGASGSILRYVNQTIEAWMVRKFKRFMGSQGQDRPRSRTTISRTSRVVRAMEDRHTRLVRLMGA
ncbi:hypothetical protein IVA80_04860 [Bradyrhizobium sp. 139]|nr:hypothetical protein [Bradyrhizobium sp. 139]